jgi:sugar O-acyltransferase (sialic acid O-acetyltransferase NeuD family)
MDLWIVGAGGLGREVLDACLAAGHDVTGFLDDGRAGDIVRGLAVRAPADAEALPGAAYVIGIADPAVRSRLAALLDSRGLRPMTVQHPTGTVAPETVVGDGCVLLANTYLSSSVTLGEHTQVQYSATIGHDAELGKFVTVYPGANVSGGVVLADGSSVGSNAVVLQGRSIGEGAFVGAGSVVTRDVASGVTVVGSPARRLNRQ